MGLITTPTIRKRPSGCWRKRAGIPTRKIDLLTDYTDPLTAQLLPAIAAMLGQVGIKATPKVLQGPALTEYYYNNNVDIWYDGSWGIPSVTVWPGQYDDPVWVDGEGNEYGEYADGLTPKGGNLMGFHPEWAQQALEEYRAASPERKSELLKMIPGAHGAGRHILDDAGALQPLDLAQGLGFRRGQPRHGAVELRRILHQVQCLDLVKGLKCKCRERVERSGGWEFFSLPTPHSSLLTAWS